MLILSCLYFVASVSIMIGTFVGAIHKSDYLEVLFPFVCFIAMSYGLWFHKHWARLIQVLICGVLSLTGSMYVIWLLLLSSEFRSLKLPALSYRELALFVAFIILNVGIVKCLIGKKETA